MRRRKRIGWIYCRIGGFLSEKNLAWWKLDFYWGFCGICVFHDGFLMVNSW